MASLLLLQAALSPLSGSCGRLLSELKAVVEANQARRKPKIPKGARDMLPDQVCVWGGGGRRGASLGVGECVWGEVCCRTRCRGGGQVCEVGGGTRYVYVCGGEQVQRVCVCVCVCVCVWMGGDQVWGRWVR